MLYISGKTHLCFLLELLLPAYTSTFITIIISLEENTDSLSAESSWEEVNTNRPIGS